MTIVESRIFDGTSYLKAVWFNQAFRGRQLVEGAEVALSGKVERFRGQLQMKAPEVDVLKGSSESLVTGRVVPIHPGVGKATPGYVRRGIHNALGRARPITGSICPSRCWTDSIYSLVTRAISAIHFPESSEELPAARRRLVFDEFFRLEVALAMTKRRKMADSNGIRAFQRFDSRRSVRVGIAVGADRCPEADNRRNSERSGGASDASAAAG